MTQFQSAPHLVYQATRTIVNALMIKLNEQSSDKQAQQTTKLGLDILSELHGQINQQLESLDKNAEWNTFTIAFYGETNAGKSTIIETLRILLGEESKVEQQQLFKQWQLETGITQTAFDELRRNILESESTLRTQSTVWQQESAQLNAKLDGLLLRYELQLESVDKTKCNANLWRRFTWLFIQIPDVQELQALQNSVLEQRIFIIGHQESFQSKQRELELHIKTQRDAHEEIQSQAVIATPFADGAIIGNGRSDFTLESQAFNFTKNDRKFALLDVPGIEGKESKVSDAIWQAVQKAHAVFYVTGKPAVPEKGDEDNPGTLDKIKSHLGDQSEVYTVYNKRVTNPMQLDKSELLNDGERESLLVLDDKMREYLGASYQKTISLSAYPAFLASSTCLLPGSSNQRNQTKFLDRYSSAQLQEKTQTNSLINMFTQESVEAFKEKIIHSNKNKAKQVVHQALVQVRELQNEKFSPLLKQLRLGFEDTANELENDKKALQRRLRAKAKEKIDAFERKVRSKTYDDIDNEISNDSFKSSLKKNIKDQQEILKEELPLVLDTEMKKFQEQLTDVIARFQVQTSELIGLYNNIGHAKANFNFKLDDGINKIGIIGSLVGGIALAWNPMGWILIAISATTLLFSVYKSVRSFLSSDYKKSQQRKSTNENLRNIVNDINQNLEENLPSSIEQVTNNIEEIKSAMSLSVNHIETVHTQISYAGQELNNIYNQLEA
jgi:predicted ATPase